MPYLNKVGLSALELQQRKVETVAKCKAEMEDAKARGEGTSTHGSTTLA